MTITLTITHDPDDLQRVGDVYEGRVIVDRVEASDGRSVTLWLAEAEASAAIDGGPVRTMSRLPTLAEAARAEGVDAAHGDIECGGDPPADEAEAQRRVEAIGGPT